jgi:uncharacterized membrane protein YjjP (DUF1212 family)
MEAAPTPTPHEERVGFVLRLGRALHAYGTPSHRLEDTLVRVSDRLGVSGQFFATPTSIFASFGAVEQQHTHLLRLEPGDTNLEKLAAIDQIGGDVIAGRLSPAEGSAAIDAVESMPSRYPAALTLIAFGLVSAAAARFLGGGLREIGVASLVGILTGTLALATQRFRSWRRVFEPLAACAGGAAVTLASRAVGGAAFSIAAVAGLLILLPGLTLTIAMAELAARHLVAGTARLMGAVGAFLAIGFGVAVGSRLALFVTGPMPPVVPVPLPPWTEMLALLIAPLAMTVLLRARPSHAPSILAVVVLGFFAGRFGSALLGPELGIVVASFAAAIASNAIARALDRPVSITLVPALLLIVPGSVGFRGLASLVDRQTVSGIETAFRMVLMLSALVVGLFAAQAVAPSRRWSE